MSDIFFRYAWKVVVVWSFATLLICCCELQSSAVAIDSLPFDEAVMHETVGANQMCYWQERRHGCNLYNFPCRNNPNCSALAGKKCEKKCHDAVCKTGTESQNCELKTITTSYNICKITGEEHTMGCTAGKKACVLAITQTWRSINDPDPNTQSISIPDPDKANDRCATDPIIDRPNQPRCNQEIPNS